MRINLIRWLVRIIFFNVPLDNNSEFIRKLYYSHAQAEAETHRLGAYGWEPIYVNYTWLSNYVVWYKHKPFINGTD